MTTAFATENTDGQADIAAEVGAVDAQHAARIAEETEKAYEEFALQQALQDTDVAAIEEILKESAEAPSRADTLTLCDKIAHSLRPNPKARAMTRKGRRYCVRKDHGTTAFYKQIAALKAEVKEDTQPKRARRRQRIQDFRARREALAAQYDIGDINACPTCHGAFYVVAEDEYQCTHGYCFERDYVASDWMF